MLPLTGNRSSIVWTEGEGEGRRDHGARRGGLHRTSSPRALAPSSARSRSQVRANPFRSSFRSRGSFIADRLALIGDAAHVVHPLAGQGLNIGMRDVAALAEIIVEEARLGLDIGAAPGLERYQRWRRFDSAFSAAVMDGLNRLFSNDSAPLRVLRDLGLGLVDRAPQLKRFLVREAAGATGNVPRLLEGREGVDHGGAIAEPHRDGGFTARCRGRRGRSARPRRDHRSPVASAHDRRADRTDGRPRHRARRAPRSPVCCW